MNRIDTLKIIGTLREAYPNGAEITENTVNLWLAKLEPYDFEKAWQCTIELLGEWDKCTMPPPAALIKKLDSIPSARKAELRHEADQLIRKGSVLTFEEFEKASPEIKEYFGSLAALRRLANMTIEQADRELERFQKELPNISRKLRSADNAAALNGVAQIGSPKK